MASILPCQPPLPAPDLTQHFTALRSVFSVSPRPRAPLSPPRPEIGYSSAEPVWCRVPTPASHEQSPWGAGRVYGDPARYSWEVSLPLCFLLTPPAQASSFVSQKDTAQDYRGQLGNKGAQMDGV